MFLPLSLATPEPRIHIHRDENGELCSTVGTILFQYEQERICYEPYIYLGGAILVVEVIGTTLMKFSEGFTRIWFLCWHNYLLLCIILVISSDAGLYTYRSLAYAIWSGVGIVLISLLSGIFGQRLDRQLSYRHDVDLCRCVGSLTCCHEVPPH
ncbi:hypothetical protein DMI65_10655 [Escherichia coli]|nr:hypothetical protein [Escherichia coli]